MNIEAFYEQLYMASEPRPHQAREFALYRDVRGRACLWTMRTGKSKAMIDLSCYLFLEKRIQTTLVVAPNNVHYNWIAREIPRHRWHGVKFNVYCWSSKNKNAVDEILELMKRPEPLFLAINKESLMLDRMLDLIKKHLFKRGSAMLIVDESHHFRTPGAKQTKRLRALAKHFKVVRLLTGSSVDNSPFAAYSQFELLGEATLGHKTFADFKACYGIFEMRNVGGRIQPKEIGYQNLDVLQRYIGDVSSIVGAEGLSKYVESTEFFEMAPKQADLYKTVKKDLMLSLDSGVELRSPEAGAKMGKLQQISSGFIIDEHQNVHEIVPFESNPRLLALSEVLDSVNGKTIIWCKFKEDISLVCKLLASKGRRHVEYHGDVKSEIRQKNIDLFMTDSTVTDFVGQPAAGGEGLNLSSADSVIWYSHTFNAIERNQASARATMDDGRNIALIDICGIKTLDDYILSVLHKKKSVAEALVDVQKFKEMV